ncbi:MAG TPA: retropepsin-like aspartic protease [Acetobacteraceae bacterium]|nr:retropepsin-like aspartic protease [Acetobacteraceae bacterium]
MRATLILLVLLVVAACASDPGARRADGTCPLIPIAQVPLEVRGNLLFLQAKIGDEPVTMLVDTGAERTLLTEEAVDRLHLPRDLQHATRTFGIGSPTSTWDAKLPNGIVLGTTHFPVDVVTVGRFAIHGVAGGSADGLLGADILLAFDVDLDLPADRITFYRARRQCPDATPPWKEPYIGVDGVSTRRDRLQVPFELDGVAGLGVLDTGAQFSSISKGMAERVGLAEEAMATDRTVMAHGAAPDQVPVHIHRFREFRVGPEVMHAPMLPVVPMTSGMGDGLVGADFLRGRRTWLSFSAQRVFVTPQERGPSIAATRTEEAHPAAN